jgi:hypothetical protein
MYAIEKCNGYTGVSCLAIDHPGGWGRARVSKKKEASTVPLFSLLKKNTPTSVYVEQQRMAKYTGPLKICYATDLGVAAAGTSRSSVSESN